MAGRGRGKTTLSREQLQALGVVGKELPQVPLAPPPTFPPVMTKPVPFEPDNGNEEQILHKNKFRKRMRKKPFFTRLQTSGLENQKRQCLPTRAMRKVVNRQQQSTDAFNWERMPLELSATRLFKRKKIRIAKNKKVTKEKPLPDLSKRFDELEQKEHQVGDNAASERVHRDSDGAVEDEEEEAEENMATDDEFEDDNDYGNNYFDNGESYDDVAEEPLEDGPVY